MRKIFISFSLISTLVLLIACGEKEQPQVQDPRHESTGC